LLLIDPYDTGRFPSLGIIGIGDRSMRTADASRGRDPRFNAAVIGNSTANVLTLTGYRKEPVCGSSSFRSPARATGAACAHAMGDVHHPDYGALSS